MRGFIYFLTNVSIPGLIKIGHTTTSIETRLKQLNSTGVAAPFELAVCISVPNSAQTEQNVHKALSKRRYSDEREFFSGSISEVLAEVMPFVLKNIAESNAGSIKLRKKYFDLEEFVKNILTLKKGMLSY